MSNLFWLTETHVTRLRPIFPKAIAALVSMICEC